MAATATQHTSVSAESASTTGRPPVSPAGTEVGSVSEATPQARRFPWLLTLIALAITAALVYQFAIVPSLVPKNFGVVVEGKVYRSGRMTTAAMERVIRERNIKTIVDLGAYDKHPERERNAQRTAEALGVKRYAFRLEGDGTGNPNFYVAALRIIGDPANHPVLVHCSAGAQRTSGCIMLYRNVIEGRPFAEVAHEAFEHDHDPDDNRRLFPYLLDWHDDIERAYRAGPAALIPGQPAPTPANVPTSPAAAPAPAPQP